MSAFKAKPPGTPEIRMHALSPPPGFGRQQATLVGRLRHLNKVLWVGNKLIIIDNSCTDLEYGTFLEGELLPIG